MLSQDSSYDFWAILALPKLLMFKRKLLYKIIWSKTINYWGGNKLGTDIYNEITNVGEGAFPISLEKKLRTTKPTAKD